MGGSKVFATKTCKNQAEQKAKQETCDRVATGGFWAMVLLTFTTRMTTVKLRTSQSRIPAVQSQKIPVGENDM